MAQIRVIVQGAGGGYHRWVQLPGDIAVERLLNLLPQKVGERMLRDNGEPIDFYLFHNDRQVPPDQTLVEAGVRDGDTLTLTQEAAAGSGRR
jgi:hypothetical protein